MTSSFTRLLSNAISALASEGDAAIRTLVSHAAQVLTVRAGGLVDLIADDERMGSSGGMTKRTVTVGLPGVKLDLRAGRRARLGFLAGLSSGVEVHGFEQDASANRPVARRGDKGTLGTLTYTPLPTTPPSGRLDLNLASSPYDPTPGGARNIGITFIGAVTGMAPGIPMNLIVWLTTGSPEVMLSHFDDEATP